MAWNYDAESCLSLFFGNQRDLWLYKVFVCSNSIPENLNTEFSGVAGYAQIDSSLLRVKEGETPAVRPAWIWDVALLQGLAQVS